MPARRSSMSMSVGLGSGNRSANNAAANTNAIQPSALQNSGPSRRRRDGATVATSSSRARSSVAMTYPRIEDGVEQVDDEVHQHEASGNQQHHALQDDEVAGIDRADQEPADARQSEDRLHDAGAADQPPDIDAG